MARSIIRLLLFAFCEMDEFVEDPAQAVYKEKQEYEPIKSAELGKTVVLISESEQADFGMEVHKEIGERVASAKIDIKCAEDTCKYEICGGRNEYAGCVLESRRGNKLVCEEIYQG